jgi:anti-sigma B factor antagonist
MPSSDEPQATVKLLVVPEIVALPREVDISNAPRIGSELLGAFGPRATVVIADMSLTEFCDSSGIRHLLIANDAASARGCELRLALPSPSVLRVMQTLGIDRMLRIYPSLEEALAGKPNLEAEA